MARTKTPTRFVALLLLLVCFDAIGELQSVAPASGWTQRHSPQLFSAPEGVGTVVCNSLGESLSHLEPMGNNNFRIYCVNDVGDVHTGYQRGFTAYFTKRCAPGYEMNVDVCIANTGGGYPNGAKNQGNGANDGGGECGEGNPINPAVGNKFQIETDYRGTAPFPLEFRRYYNSAAPVDPFVMNGQGWTHTYTRRLRATGIEPPGLYAIDYYRTGQYNTYPVPNFAENSGRTSATIVRPNGNVHYFVHDTESGEWLSDSDITSRLEQIVDANGAIAGWRLINNRDEVEHYDARGTLRRITDRTGLTQTLGYDAEDRLQTVTGPFGRTLSFTYDAANRISTMTDPDGGVFTYAYDANDNLIEVTYPNTTTRQYHYEDPDHPNALTGITDANGDRFATWAYDDEGRAVLSEHAGGADRVEIAYPDFVTAVVTGTLGEQRTYTFGNVLGVRRSTHIEGGTCSSCSQAESKTYDANGFIASRTDRNGVVTQYQHNARGLQVSRTEAVGTAEQRTITTEWHPGFRLPTRVIGPGKTTEYQYDANGNLLSRTEIDTSGAAAPLRTTTFTYDANGLLLSVDGPRTDVADVTTFAYDSAGNRVSITNALGHETHITEYDAHGNPLTLVDPNGVTTELVYDARQRLVSRTVAAGSADSATTSIQYDGVGNLTRIIQPNGAYLQYTYDAAHRLVEVADNQGNRIHYTLDAAGNRLQEDTYDPDGVLVRTQQQVFNNLGRLIQRIGANSQTTHFAYDDEGNNTGITDGLNRQTSQGFDALGRLIRVVDPALGETHYAYDAQDNLTAVTDPTGLTTAYHYNGYGELLEQDSPDTGLTTYQYDSAGNRIEMTDARGVTVHYQYDALNRLTFIDYSGSAEDVTYSYDQGANGIGRLTGIVDASGSTDYQYDARGNLVQQTSEIEGISYTTAYSYDAADQLLGLTYPDGSQAQYTRNALGQVTQASLSSGGQTRTVASDIAYLPFGPMTALTYGNGLPASYDYDRDYRLTGLQVPGIQQLDFQYDAVDNLTAKSDLRDPAQSQDYTYDSLDRLIDAQGGYGQIGYDYDAIGNRLSKSADGRVAAYDYAADSHHLITRDGVGYQYDAVGNTVDNGALAFAYNPANRLSEVRDASQNLLVQNTYNALGQRVIKQGSETTHFHYDTQGMLLAESDPDGTVHRQYLYLNGQRLALTNLGNGTGGGINTQHGDQFQFDLEPDDDTDPTESAQVEIDAAAKTMRLTTSLGEVFEVDYTNGGWEDTYDGNRREIRGWSYQSEPGFSLRIYNDGTYNAYVNVMRYPPRYSYYMFTQLDETVFTDGEATLSLDPDNRGFVLERPGFPTESHTVTEDNWVIETRDAWGGGQEQVITFVHDEERIRIEGEYFFERTNPIAKARTVEGQIHRSTYVDNDVLSEPGEPATTAGLYFIHGDHLDTPQAITDADQAVVWAAEYSPFGEATVTTETITNHLRFPGQYFDTETGLHYNYFRDYDPEIGRYIESDPIGLQGGLNLYLYVNGDVVNRFDYLGLSPSFPGTARSLAKKGLESALGIPVNMGRHARTLGFLGMLLQWSPLGCGSLDCDGDGLNDVTRELMFPDPEKNQACYDTPPPRCNGVVCFDVRKDRRNSVSEKDIFRDVTGVLNGVRGIMDMFGIPRAAPVEYGHDPGGIRG